MENNNLKLNHLMLHKLNNLLINYDFAKSQALYSLNYNYKSDQIKNSYTIQSFFQSLFEIKDSTLFIEFNRNVEKIDPLIYSLLSDPNFRLYLSFVPKTNKNTENTEDEEFLIINWLNTYSSKIKLLTINKIIKVRSNIVGTFFNDFYADISTANFSADEIRSSILLRKSFRNIFIKNNIWFENPLTVLGEDLISYFNFYSCYLKNNNIGVIQSLFNDLPELENRYLSNIILFKDKSLLFTTSKGFDKNLLRIKNNSIASTQEINQFFKVNMVTNISDSELIIFYDNQKINFKLKNYTENKLSLSYKISAMNRQVISLSIKNNLLKRILKITRKIDFAEHNNIDLILNGNLNSGLNLNSNNFVSYLGIEYFTLENDDLSFNASFCINILKKVPEKILKLILSQFDSLKLFYCISNNDLLSLKCADYLKLNLNSFEILRLYGFTLNNKLLLDFKNNLKDFFKIENSGFQNSFSDTIKKRINNFSLNQVKFTSLRNILGLDILFNFELIDLSDMFLFNYEFLIKYVKWCRLYTNNNGTTQKISLSFSFLDQNKNIINDIGIQQNANNKHWFYSYNNISNTFSDTIDYNITVSEFSKSLNFHTKNDLDTGYFVFKSILLKQQNFFYVRLMFSDMFSNNITYDFKTS
jgi:hypothetical protein